MIFEIFILLIVFQLKHLLADYLLQSSYMLGKFKKGISFVMPLTTHCLIHAVFTLLITFAFTQKIIFAIQLMLLDFTVHFITDRIKASPRCFGHLKPTQKYYWWVLGVDQMIHHLTHYLLIYFIYTH